MLAHAAGSRDRTPLFPVVVHSLEYLFNAVQIFNIFARSSRANPAGAVDRELQLVVRVCARSF